MNDTDYEQIRAWLEAFSAAVRAVDYSRGRQMFTSDVVGFGTFAGMREGLDALEKGQWRQIWGVTRGFRFRLDELYAGVSGDLAWVAVPWDSEGQRDGEWFARPGRATLILERRNGAWLAKHSHFSLYPVNG